MLEKHLKLRYISISITENCNLGCEYCYQKEKKKVLIKNEKLKRILDFCKKFSQKEAVLGLLGGESFLFPKTLEYIFSQIKPDQFKVNISTNGTILTDSIKTLLNKNRDKIQMIYVSLDGYKEMHDRYRTYRDGSPTWDIIIKNLKYLKDNFGKVAVNIRYDGKKTSKKELLKAYQTIRKLGIEEMKIIPIDDYIPDENKKEMAEAFVEIYENNLNCAGTDGAIKLNELLLGKKKEEKSGKAPFCGAVIDTLLFNCEGDIYPCAEFWAGNHKDWCIGNIDNVDEKMVMMRLNELFIVQKKCPGKCPMLLIEEHKRKSGEPTKQLPGGSYAELKKEVVKKLKRKYAKKDLEK